MAQVIPFPQKALCVQMHFKFSENSWEMEYIFDHGEVHYQGTFTNRGSERFDEAVSHMTKVFTEQFCASSDEAG
jgi:hypothetical protein